MGRVPSSYPLCLRCPTALPGFLSYAFPFCFCLWFFVRFLCSFRVPYFGVFHGVVFFRVMWCQLRLLSGSFAVLVYVLFYGKLFRFLPRLLFRCTIVFLSFPLFFLYLFVVCQFYFVSDPRPGLPKCLFLGNLSPGGG